MSINKSLIIALIGGGIYGLFYTLDLLEIDFVIVGVFRELLVIPSLLAATVFTFIFIFKTIKKLFS